MSLNDGGRIEMEPMFFLLFWLKDLIEKEADCFSPLPMRQSSLAYTIGSEIPLIF